MTTSEPTTVYPQHWNAPYQYDQNASTKHAHTSAIFVVREATSRATSRSILPNQQPPVIVHSLQVGRHQNENVQRFQSLPATFRQTNVRYGDVPTPRQPRPQNQQHRSSLDLPEVVVTSRNRASLAGSPVPDITLPPPLPQRPVKPRPSAFLLDRPSTGYHHSDILKYSAATSFDFEPFPQSSASKKCYCEIDPGLSSLTSC